MIKQINLKKLNKKISLIYKDNSYYFKGPLGEIKLNSNYFVSPYKEKKIFINSKKLNSFINSIKNSFISVSYG